MAFASLSSGSDPLSSYIWDDNSQPDGISVETMKVEVDEDIALLRLLGSSPGETGIEFVEKVFNSVARPSYRRVASGTLDSASPRL